MNHEPPVGVGRDFYIVAYSASFIAFVIFAFSVYLFATFGQPWVDSLDDQIGEIVATRAAALATAGREDEALALYKEALEQTFDDERMRVLRTVDYARLLMKMDRFQESFGVCATLVELDEAYARRIFRELQEFLNRQALYEDRLRYCEPWREIGVRGDRQEIVIQALSNEAYASLRLGRRDSGIEALVELFRLRPNVNDADSLAQALVAADRRQEAIPYLEYVIANAQDDKRAQATELLSSL